MLKLFRARSIAKAIDAKSTHTAAHCQRVPVLTELIAKAACDDDTVLSDFSLTEDEWYELKMASWLHDCGKLATPEFLLNKSTKLYCELDGIDNITLRAEGCRRFYQMELLQHKCESGIEALLLVFQFAAKMQYLDDSLAFLAKANIGGEFMDKALQKKVREIAGIDWIDSQGKKQELLTSEEVEMLCIPKGTLSAQERLIINKHIEVTIDMLESLPFPKNLARVAEIAGGHHEKMDGTGYPKGLTGDQMLVQARIMAVADVFEALTAHERPYKKPMKVSTAVNIIKKMANTNHLDKAIVRVFIEREVWKTYADLHLKPEQLDMDSAVEALADF